MNFKSTFTVNVETRTITKAVDIVVVQPYTAEKITRADQRYEHVLTPSGALSPPALFWTALFRDQTH